MDGHSYVAYIRCEGNLQPGPEETSVSKGPPPVGGPLPGQVAESPERAEASAKAPSGFLASRSGRPALRPLRQPLLAGREKRIKGRENQTGSWLVPILVMVYFSRHVRGATRRRLAQTAGDRREGRSRKRRFTVRKVPPDATGRPEATGRSTDRAGILRDRRTDCRPCKSQDLHPPRRRGERSSDRTAAGFGRRHSRSELGPRPDDEKEREPREG